MADKDVLEGESTEEVGDERTKKRREFLKSAASVAVTTPAVMLMLSAGAKSNKAVAASPDGADDGGDGNDRSERGTHPDTVADNEVFDEGGHLLDGDPEEAAGDLTDSGADGDKVP